MAGTSSSTRWDGHTRRALVEECDSKPARACPQCGRRAKFLYRLPADFSFSRDFACHRCQNLAYFAESRGRSRAASIASDPDLLEELETAFFDALRDSRNLPGLGLLSPVLRRQLSTLTRALQIRELDQKRARHLATHPAKPKTAPVADEPKTLVLEELPEDYYEKIRDWARASQKS